MVEKIRKIGNIFSFWILIQTGVLFSANPGDIVITEFSLKTAGDVVYDYIEIFNTTDSPINLNAWEIKIDNSTYLIDQPLSISENGFVVFTGHAGRFQDSNGLEYFPKNTACYICPAGCDADGNLICETLPSNYYWVPFILNYTNGDISIRDNASVRTLIDSIFLRLLHIQ